MPFLPPEYQSKVENIILALLFNAADRHSYGNAKTFRPLIKELKDLESKGISVKTSNRDVLVYFVVALIIGDNLGNSMCRFMEGFTTNHPCRTCIATKLQTESLCIEDTSLLRRKVI